MRILLSLFGMFVVIASCTQKDGSATDKKELQQAISHYKDSLKQAEKRQAANRYARELAQKAGKYADLYPKDTMTPKYHYLLGDLHFSYLNNAEEALKHLKTLRKSYPEHEKAPFALFTAGFFYEQLGKTRKAEQQYALFLDKYSDHKLADDVRLSKERLGKSAKEQLQEALEQRRERQNDSAGN